MFLYKSKHEKVSTDHGAGFFVYGLMYIEQKPCAWQRFFYFWEKVRSTTKGWCAVSFQSETYLIMSIMRGCFLAM